SIAKFCPNLRKLRTEFRDYETLKMIFDNCQYLESLKFSLNKKDTLKVIAEYSPKNFCELELKLQGSYHYYSQDKLESLLPEELESFFISWKNRASQKLLSLTVVGRTDLVTGSENMKMIERYIKLGVVKKFDANRTKKW